MWHSRCACKVAATALLCFCLSALAVILCISPGHKHAPWRALSSPGLLVVSVLPRSVSLPRAHTYPQQVHHVGTEEEDVPKEYARSTTMISFNGGGA